MSANSGAKLRPDAPAKSKRGEVAQAATSASLTNASPVVGSPKASDTSSIRDIKNVLRWRVPHESPERPRFQERPRSAPSSTLAPTTGNYTINSRATKQAPPSPKPSPKSTKASNISVHKRHWIYLFDNLHRAIDEMYKTCEHDFSVEECINVIQTLEFCMLDFRRLIGKVEAIKTYEDSPGKIARPIMWEEPQLSLRPANPGGSQSNPSTPVSKGVNPIPRSPRSKSMSQSGPNSRATSPIKSNSAATKAPEATEPRLVDTEQVSAKTGESEANSTKAVNQGSVANKPVNNRPVDSKPVDNKAPDVQNVQNQQKSVKGKPAEAQTKKEDAKDNSQGKEEEVGWAERLKRSLKTSSEAFQSISKSASAPTGSQNDSNHAQNVHANTTPRLQITVPDNTSPGVLSPTSPLSNTKATSPQTSPRAAGPKVPPSQTSTASQTTPPKLLAPGSPERSMHLSRSPTSHPPFSPILSDPWTKVMRDERKRKSPMETRQLQDERLSLASKKREDFVSKKKDKATQAINRVKEANVRNTQRLAIRQTTLEEKHEKAGHLHGAQIDIIKKKALNENNKVNELAWMQSQSNENMKYLHQQKLESGKARRADLLEQRRKKSHELTSQKEEAAAERRRKNGQAKMQKVRLDLGSDNPLRVRKLCKICEIEICGTEEELANHLRGKKHMKALSRLEPTDTAEEAVVPFETPLPVTLPMGALSEDQIKVIAVRERDLKKKSKRLRQLISQLAPSYVDPGVHPPRETPHKARLARFIQDLKVSSAKRNLTGMQPALIEINRILGAKGGLVDVDLQTFRQLGGIDAVAAICGLQGASLPPSIYLECINSLSFACTQPSNRLYMLVTGRLIHLIDLLGKSIVSSCEFAFLPNLITLLTLHMWQVIDNADQMKEALVDYIISTCLFEKIEQRLARLQSALDHDRSSQLVEKLVEFLESVTAFMLFNARDKPVFTSATKSCGPIVSVFKETRLVGILPLLASILIHERPARSGNPVSLLPETVWSIIFSSVKVLNNLATLDLKFLQEYLSSEEYQTEVYHLLGNLLWYCSGSQESELTNASNNIVVKRNRLLNETILLIGYYALQNEKTQEIFQWGNSPNILQQLCNVPFRFFSDSRYKMILFPTMMAISSNNPRNLTIIQQEMSTDLLVEFIKTELSPQVKIEDPSPVPARFLVKNRLPKDVWNEAALPFYQKAS